MPIVVRTMDGPESAAAATIRANSVFWHKGEEALEVWPGPGQHTPYVKLNLRFLEHCVVKMARFLSCRVQEVPRDIADFIPHRHEGFVL